MSELKTISINEIKDFNMAHIFECGQCFRWNKEGDAYVGVVGNYAAKVSCSESTLIIEATGGDETFWRNYFDLDTDYGEIKKSLVAADCKIKSAVDYGYGIRILNQDLFETTISFIISQNNNIPRIKKCIEAICREYGESLGVEFGSPRYAFPTPAALASIPVTDLAALKLGYRSEYIVATAKQFAATEPPRTREDLLSYLGVGPKVANCIMLFGLHDVSAFPIDTWVKHIMNDMYGFSETDTKGMADYAEKHFGEYAGYAQQYLFFYYRENA